jgi:hypothetical protein
MRRLFVVLALVLVAAPLNAQGASKTIAPGMSRANVIAVLGEPATVRSAAEFTYLFYQNSCGKECGMNDLVVLRGDSVVDAIFRSPSRHYSGKSSSPAPISPKDAARAKPATTKSALDVKPAATKPAASAKPATTARPSTRMKPPAEANDVRPSIPVKPPTISPAPSSPPATRSP